MSPAFHPTLLNNRSVIHATGKDAGKLLQGLLTCNLEHLEKPGEVIYGFLLTPQGRFLHELFVIKTEDGFLLDTYNGNDGADAQNEATNKLLKRLKIYTLKSNATFAIDETQAVMACAEKPSAHPQRLTITDPRHGELGYRTYGELTALETLADDDGNAPNYDEHRITLGIPSAEDFVPEKTLLLDYDIDQLGGVDFEKGCYVGQEVTARMHYRGIDKKGIYRACQTNGELTAHTPIIAGDKEVGHILSVAGKHGLAMVRHEHINTELTAAGQPITLCRPAWITPDRR